MASQTHHNQRFILAMILMMGVFLMLPMVSAFDFDNIIEYKNNDMTVDIYNSIVPLLVKGDLLGSVTLTSHSSITEVKQVLRGRDRIVMYYDSDFLSEENLGKVTFIDMNTGREISKGYKIVEMIYETREKPIYSGEKCVIEGKNKTTICTPTIIGYEEYDVFINTKEITKVPNYKTRIGLMTDVNDGDYIDAIWTIAGKELVRHAEWTDSFNTDLVSYYDGNSTLDLYAGYNLTAFDGNLNFTNFNCLIGNCIKTLQGNTFNITLTPAVNFYESPATLNFWVSALSVSGNPAIANLPTSATKKETILYGSGVIRFANLEAFDTYFTNAVVTTPNWNMVTIIRNSSSISAFVNGVYVDSAITFYEPALNISGIGFGKTGAESDLNGAFDEIGLWNRALTNAEITDLYNGGSGITYTLAPTISVMTVSLASYPNNTNTTLNSFSFNSTAVQTYGNMTNATLYLWNASNYALTNYTAITGMPNSTGLNLTLSNIPDGVYNWNVEYCGLNLSSSTLCTFSASNNTFMIDATSPSVNIIYPTSPIEYGYIGKNVSLNFSASDTNLDKCWYNYNGTNTIINCNVNSTFILTTQQNITLYANDSSGNVASDYVDWGYTYFEINQTYSTIAYETSTENFYLNLNYNSSAYGVTAILNYDGTNYTSINTGAGDNGIFKATITIPLITTSANKTFFWYVNGIRNINYNQTVSPIVLQLCNVTYNATALNFTYYDESNLLPIDATTNNTIIKATFGYWIGDGSVKKAYSYQNLTATTNNFAFCISPPQLNMTMNLAMEYGAVDFLDNNYELQNNAISNITRNITLYLLPINLGTKFTHTLRRGIDFIPNTLVSIEKYFVGIGQWRNIGIRKTDNTGRFVAYLELDKNYNYTVQEDDGSIIASIENTAICLTAPCEITLQIETTSLTVFSEMEAYIAQNVIYSLTYNKTIKMVNLNFTDLTGTANYWRMWVYKPYFGNETMDTICNITSFTSIGVMECNTTGYYGDIVARVYISRSPEIIVDFLTFLNEDRTEALGTSGLLASILILLVIILTASRSASGALIMIPFGLVILKFLGFLPLSWGVVVGVVIFIIIIAMKMRT